MTDHVETLKELARCLERDGQHITGVSFPEVAVAIRAVLEELANAIPEDVLLRNETLGAENARLKAELEIGPDSDKWRRTEDYQRSVDYGLEQCNRADQAEARIEAALAIDLPDPEEWNDDRVLFAWRNGGALMKGLVSKALRREAT